MNVKSRKVVAMMTNMKNPTKYLSLLIMLPALMLLFSAFAQKQQAITTSYVCKQLSNPPNCTACIDGEQTCTLTERKNEFSISTTNCNPVVLAPQSCMHYSFSGGSCVQNSQGYFTTPDCSELPTPTVTPAQTVKPSFYWTQIAYCPVLTPVDKFEGDDNLKFSDKISAPISTKAPTSTPTPTQTPTPTPTISNTNPFPCEILTTGDYKGNYYCGKHTSDEIGTQCKAGYGPFDPQKQYPAKGFTGTTCLAKQGCCKQGAPTATPTPTPTPTTKPTNTPAPAATLTPTRTPTPVPVNNITLALSLNAQDVPLTSDNLSANLSLYNLTTNAKEPGAPETQLFTRTPIPGKQYSANISLANLHRTKYFIIARRGNMIAKSLFTVGSANATIPVPTATLVFGDLNDDNDINILDHDGVFRSCWNRPATSSCLSSDLVQDGKIDQLDYNTWLKGYATWRKEGQ